MVKFLKRLTLDGTASHLEANNAVLDQIFVFHLLVKFLIEVAVDMDKGEGAGASYLDLKEAFNPVNHGIHEQKRKDSGWRLR